MIWMIFAVAAVKDWFVKQIDFITVFLNEILEETIYMILSIKYAEENLICKLNQKLYRLKQSFRIWYDMLTAFLKKIDFTVSNWDTDLWYHKDKKIYLTIYVDNIKLIESDESMLDSICEQIAKRFDINKLNETHHYLEMKMIQDQEWKQIQLSQKIYIKNLLIQYEMKCCHSRSMLMIDNLQITDKSVDDKDFIHKY